MAKEEEDKKKKKAPPAKSLDELKKTINKEYGDGAVMQGRDSIVIVDYFPTYVASIDRALGIGGLPQGRIIEIYGMESSGKTTTCLQFIAACQRYKFPNKKRYGVAAFIDVEHAYDPTWAKKCGVDTDKILFSQPNSGEEAFHIAEKMTESGLVDLIVIDSVAALVPQAELDGEVTDNTIGGQARLMSKGLRRLKGIANTTKTTIIFINQVRMKIGVMFGNPETTPGGLALKFYASVRAQILKGSAIKEGDDTLGFSPTLKIIKNKCAAPFVNATYDICVGNPRRPVYGIDEVGSLLEVAKDMKVIETSSSYYIFNGKKYNGVGAATAFVRENPDIQETIRNKIYSSLQERALVVGKNEDIEDEDPLADDILDQVLEQNE